jgi:DNA polymerase|tara:strand:- start:4359 stop:5030 length:672 start_codon:yes stop_codon:yes gene_type:complete
MDNKQYQKNILLELMNLNEFKSNESINVIDVNVIQNSQTKKPSVNDIKSLDDLEKQLRDNFSFKNSIVEGAPSSNILFFYGKCAHHDEKILDGLTGDLFDKMLSSIKLDRNLISLSSYIPRGLEHLSDDENFLNTIQLFNYKLIELINPKYLIIMSNFCIKMLLATDLSSMSLRGKWFDFNTPNDVTPKRCRVLYEPEILINNPDLKKDAWEDLKEIKRQLGG